MRYVADIGSHLLEQYYKAEAIHAFKKAAERARLDRELEKAVFTAP